ncbi:hypothetical protein Tco_0356753 [Tanacetum coccineum]
MESPISPMVSDSNFAEPSLNSKPLSGRDTPVGSATSDPDDEPLGSPDTADYYGGSEFSKDDPSEDDSVDALSDSARTNNDNLTLSSPILAWIDDWIAAYPSSPPPSPARSGTSPAFAPALPVKMLPPRKRFTASKRIETLKREVESLTARLAAVVIDPL